jgi:hypothetical protein
VQRRWRALCGGDHKTGQDEDPIKHFRALEEWTRERFHSIEEIEYCWSGQVLEPDDYLAFINPIVISAAILPSFICFIPLNRPA